MKENTPGHRITEVWLFVAIDEDDDEGLPCIAADGVALPLVCTDMARVDSLRHIAQALAHTKTRIELRKFSACEVVEVFGA